jgi:hypothetical protein
MTRSKHSLREVVEPAHFDDQEVTLQRDTFLALGMQIPDMSVGGDFEDISSGGRCSLARTQNFQTALSEQMPVSVLDCCRSSLTITDGPGLDLWFFKPLPRENLEAWVDKMGGESLNLVILKDFDPKKSPVVNARVLHGYLEGQYFHVPRAGHGSY